MMTIVFLSLAVIIAIVVILVSAKHIKKGFEARGEVKEQQRNENVSQEAVSYTHLTLPTNREV